ncbi:MAG: ABC transporter ATP-binding protein, partial [Akkermansia sp.]|nr:ABC transporter ATP-binding protein [Akkermansia sp.]
MMPISAGQAVKLSRISIGYDNIRAFLQSHYSGTRFIYYVYCKDDTVTISRQRQRNSIARIHFGLHVELELLNPDVEFVLDGVELQAGAFVNTSYYTPFTVQGYGPFAFGDLQPEDESGHSFQLAPGTKKVIVSNLPYMNSPGVLMLTPGLAPGAIFEVRYSRASNTGELRVLEGAAHTLTVQGEPVKGDTPLKDGDLIGLSAVQYLRCRFSAGVLDEESSIISSLNVESLTRDFGRAGRVLDNIGFSLKRGEMACVLGPSGSGKSTMLSMLAGHLSPTFGEILYNGEKMTPHAAELRRHIAYIPREDILDEAMTVGEHVYQASIARRPRLSHADRMRRVLAILSFVGISHLTKRNVGRAGERTISDGERTRLNLGLDLTGTADVFLIDEPISGLSSGDADKVIQTLENMASGRILLCTLHRPAQNILNRFKKVMVLTSKGQMAFWGSPEEMMTYFRKAAQQMGLIIPPEAIAAGGADYVFEVLEASYNSLKTSEQTVSELWQARYESEMHRLGKKTESPDPNARKIPRVSRRNPLELWRLFSLWVSRTYLGRIRSRLGLYAVLLEGPVLALLIAGTLRAASETTYSYYKALHINEYLFLSIVL